MLNNQNTIIESNIIQQYILLNNYFNIKKYKEETKKRNFDNLEKINENEKKLKTDIDIILLKDFIDQKHHEKLQDYLSNYDTVGELFKGLDIKKQDKKCRILLQRYLLLYVIN